MWDKVVGLFCGRLQVEVDNDAQCCQGQVGQVAGKLGQQLLSGVHP